MALLGALLAPGAAIAAAPDLRPLARDFVCPEKLPDDAARFAAMKRFMRRYQAIAPRATVNERLAFHDRLLAKRNCAEPTAQYTFPQL